MNNVNTTGSIPFFNFVAQKQVVEQRRSHAGVSEVMDVCTQLCELGAG